MQESHTLIAEIFSSFTNPFLEIEAMCIYLNLM